MANDNGTKTLKCVLVIYTIVVWVYGLCLFFIPGVLAKIAGGNPVDLGWLRWPGGILIAFGIGALLVRSNPAKQGIFVLSISLGTLLSGLALLYSWIVHEYSAGMWFIALATIVVLVLSALLWWGRQKAKAIL
jgi:hypothetical protein